LFILFLLVMSLFSSQKLISNNSLLLKTRDDLIIYSLWLNDEVIRIEKEERKAQEKNIRLQRNYDAFYTKANRTLRQTEKNKVIIAKDSEMANAVIVDEFKKNRISKLIIDEYEAVVGRAKDEIATVFDKTVQEQDALINENTDLKNIINTKIKEINVLKNLKRIDFNYLLEVLAAFISEAQTLKLEKKKIQDEIDILIKSKTQTTVIEEERKEKKKKKRKKF